MKLYKTLERKFILGTASGLVISALIFISLFTSLYQTELSQERAKTANQINQLLRSVLENAMLKRDLEGLRHIVNRLGSQPGIDTVMILNPKGEVRFSDDPTRLGQHLDVSKLLGGDAIVSINEAGRELLRSINPVSNREACIACHGPIALNPVNGILLVDYNAEPMRNEVLGSTLLLMGSGALIVLVNITGGWWFMRRFVLKPLRVLSQASTSLSHGHLSTRVELHGDDELTDLGNTFNQMADNLQLMLAKLEAKEAFLKNLLNAIPDGVRVIDQDYRVVMANDAYYHQLKAQPGIHSGRLCYECTHARKEPCPPTLHTCPLEVILKSEEPVKALHRHVATDGSELDVEIYAAPVYVEEGGQARTLIVESIRDLAEKVMYSHEQKLSEIGKLAAGVAHEIHNPLATVRFALHSAQHSLAASDTDMASINRQLELLDKEIDKCIDVTHRLLRLSATPSPHAELVDVNDAVFETLSLLRWEAEHDNIELVSVPAPGSPRVMATDSEIRMVALNLAQNAFHAMPDGGRLMTSIESKDGSVLIVFIDTGVGIPPEDMQRIFDPFYSRRANNTSGTGLGLSISRSIVEQYNGTLTVTSTVGTGSTFIVSLPDADRQERGSL